MRTPAVLVAALAILAGCATPTSDDAPSEPVRYDAIRFETSAGTMTAILFCDETPKTCTFMRTLVESGYYDGRSFGRVIPGFVIQEVDRTGGTTDQAERVEAEFGTNVHFSAGAIGIARDADPNSGSSEFFIMDFATGHLYGNYTAFAQVIDGIDVVHAIARVPSVRTGPASNVAGAPPGSPVAFGIHDRVPVDPPTITRAVMATAEIPANIAARYPLIAGESTITDTYRATLEWPRDVRANATHAITWYVAPRGTGATPLQDPAPIDLTGATIRIDGPAPTALPTQADPVPGILHASWTPTLAGAYTIRLLDDNDEIAKQEITIP